MELRLLALSCPDLGGLAAQQGIVLIKYIVFNTLCSIHCVPHPQLVRGPRHVAIRLWSVEAGCQGPAGWPTSASALLSVPPGIISSSSPHTWCGPLLLSFLQWDDSCFLLRRKASSTIPPHLPLFAFFLCSSFCVRHQTEMQEKNSWRWEIETG
jgi:hypothetical protein